MFVLKHEKGFTLIELMIVVAIIGIMVAIAVPNFIAYRDKSRISSAIATSESIRGALAGYAASSVGNTFPDKTTAATGGISSWSDLSTLCNRNGSTLASTAIDQGYSPVFTYQPFPSGNQATACDNSMGNANPCGDYYFVFRVAGVPKDLMGAQIELRTSGIIRQSY